jgi:hypothetical protein
MVGKITTCVNRQSSQHGWIILFDRHSSSLYRFVAKIKYFLAVKRNSLVGVKLLLWVLFLYFRRSSMMMASLILESLFISDNYELFSYVSMSKHQPNLPVCRHSFLNAFLSVSLTTCLRVRLIVYLISTGVFSFFFTSVKVDKIFGFYGSQ